MRPFSLHKILMVIAFVVFSQLVFGQMSNYKSLYIYNFIKRIEWPIVQSDETFHIVIYGDRDTFESLVKIAESKLAGDRPIKVEYIDEAEGIEVYVNGNRRVTEIKISQDLIKNGDKEAIEELLQVATNKALESANNVNEMEMASAARGMMPGMF